MIIKISSIDGVDMQINWVKSDDHELSGRLFVIGHKGFEYSERYQWVFAYTFSFTNGVPHIVVSDEYGSTFDKPCADEKFIFDALMDVLLPEFQFLQ